MTLPSSPVAPSGGAILLVEDEPFVAIMAQQVLEDDGFEVHAAGCGADALALAGNLGAPLQAAIVDFGLPDMGGDEVVRRMRSLRPHLPVLVASGYGVPDMRAAFQGEAICFVSKPYDGAALKQALARLGVVAGRK